MRTTLKSFSGAKALALFALCAAMVVVVGCARSIPEREPDVTRARVTGIERGNGYMRVDVRIEDAGADDISQLRLWVDQNTDVFMGSDGSVAESVASKIEPGVYLDLWFDKGFELPDPDDVKGQVFETNAAVVLIRR